MNKKTRMNTLRIMAGLERRLNTIIGLAVTFGEEERVRDLNLERTRLEKWIEREVECLAVKGGVE